MGARHLKSSISISSLITWPTKLKLYRMLLDVGAHSRSVPDFSIPSQGAGWRVLLKFSNRFTAYNFHPIELKRDCMILDISSLHRSKSDVFDFLPGGAVRVRRLNSFNRLTDYSFHPIELKLNRMIPDISRRFFSILTLGDVGTPVEISQTS